VSDQPVLDLDETQRLVREAQVDSDFALLESVTLPLLAEVSHLRTELERTHAKLSMVADILRGAQEERDALRTEADDWKRAAAAERDAAEAEVSRLRTERDEARQIIRRVHQAIREHTTAAAVALAMVSKGDGPPSFLDEIDALRAQVAEQPSRQDAALAAAQQTGDRIRHELDGYRKAIEALRDEVAYMAFTRAMPVEEFARLSHPEVSAAYLKHLVEG
jgi:uncharacterized protein (DUF3084 family)